MVERMADYFIINVGDGAMLERLSKDELEQRLDDNYYGEDIEYLERETGYKQGIDRWDLMANRGLLIIKGELVEPIEKPIIKWKVP